MDQDQDQMESIEVYDPAKKCHFRISIPHQFKNDTDNEEEIIFETESQHPNVTLWSHHESLALINFFAMHKDKFKDSRSKKGLWKLVSNELAKIGIHKAPEKCDIKWRNLLRVYRQYAQEKRGRGKFEFFDVLDSILANDSQFKYLFTNPNSSVETTARVRNDSDGDKNVSIVKKRKCSCYKSDKQKRHDDRIALMTKKLEIEERKVQAFEEYLKFLKSNSKTD